MDELNNNETYNESFNEGTVESVGEESHATKEEEITNKYGASYRVDTSYIDRKPERPKKKRKEKGEKKTGFFVRLIACLILGVVFGASAAGAFYAVNTFVLKDKTEVSKASSEDVAALEQRLSELQKSVLTTSSTNSASSAIVTSDVTAVVDKVMPSMVAVTNLGTATTMDWFGRTYSQDTESCGSGIIIGDSDTEYFIATNHHVIEGAKNLSVAFIDESVAEAYVKGYDSTMDIAVIAVAKSSLTKETMYAISVAELGDSNNIKMGEPAIAIGNALGYGQSVTTGVISALGRDMTIENVTYENLIQTSAAINPGNSGGALLNVKGELIGINSSKVGGDAVEGVGFAIPISEVKDILKEFSDRVTRNKVSDSEKGYLGVTISSNIDPTQYGYPAGALVNEVSEGSGAAAAGIYRYDVITKINGQSVSSYTELSENLSYYKVGETVTITVARVEAGEIKYLDLQVTLGARSQ